MFNRILFCLAVGMGALNAHADPSPEFIKYFNIMNGAVENNDAALACASGKSALQNSAGLPNEAIQEFTEIVNQACQRVKGQAILKDAFTPGTEMNTYIKENCTKFNAAKQRCATAGSYDKCMQILVPGISDPGMSCNFIK
jgi:hypothetical protein